MKIYTCVGYLDSGEVVSLGKMLLEDNADLPSKGHGMNLIWTDTEGMDVNSLWVIDGKLHDIPPKPDHGYTFSVETMSWTAPDRVIGRDIISRRNDLLAETDWVRMRALDQGVPLSQEWLDWFQALRDITNQSGFPHQVEWPEQPEL